MEKLYRIITHTQFMLFTVSNCPTVAVPELVCMMGSPPEGLLHAEGASGVWCVAVGTGNAVQCSTSGVWGMVIVTFKPWGQYSSAVCMALANGVHCCRVMECR